MEKRQMTLAFCHNETCRYHWVPRKPDPRECPRCQRTNITVKEMEVYVP